MTDQEYMASAQANQFTAIPAILPGPRGNKGWSPVYAAVVDGARLVQKVSDWTGGEGEKPATGQYISPNGLTSIIADAVDFRGIQGLQGPIGKSAYQLWLEAGNTGTVADYLMTVQLGKELGSWNPVTNNPALSAVVTTIPEGGYYLVNTKGPAPFAGSNFAAGQIFSVGDRISKPFGSTQWSYTPYSDTAYQKASLVGSRSDNNTYRGFGELRKVLALPLSIKRYTASGVSDNPNPNAYPQVVNADDSVSLTNYTDNAAANYVSYLDTLITEMAEIKYVLSGKVNLLRTASPGFGLGIGVAGSEIGFMYRADGSLRIMTQFTSTSTIRAAGSTTAYVAGDSIIVELIAGATLKVRTAKNGVYSAVIDTGIAFSGKLYLMSYGSVDFSYNLTAYSTSEIQQAINTAASAATSAAVSAAVNTAQTNTNTAIAAVSDRKLRLTGASNTTVAIAGGTARIVLSSGYDYKGDPDTLIIILHGNGQSNTSGPSTSARAFLAANKISYAIINVQDDTTEPFDAFATGWGNEVVLNRNIALYNYLMDKYNFHRSVILAGQSMGMLGAAHLAYAKPFPIRFVISIGGVPDLVYMFNNGINRKPTMRAAYGLAADGSEDAQFPARTQGFNWASKNTFTGGDGLKYKFFDQHLYWVVGMGDNTYTTDFGGDVVATGIKDAINRAGGFCTYKPIPDVYHAADTLWDTIINGGVFWKEMRIGSAPDPASQLY